MASVRIVVNHPSCIEDLKLVFVAIISSVCDGMEKKHLRIRLFNEISFALNVDRPIN